MGAPDAVVSVPSTTTDLPFDVEMTDFSELTVGCSTAGEPLLGGVPPAVPPPLESPPEVTTKVNVNGSLTFPAASVAVSVAVCGPLSTVAVLTLSVRASPEGQGARNV